MVPTCVQAVGQVFKVLVPSVAGTVASLAGSTTSQATNLSLTDATTIANTLESAVQGATSSGATSAGQVGILLCCVLVSLPCRVMHLVTQRSISEKGLNHSSRGRIGSFNIMFFR